MCRGFPHWLGKNRWRYIEKFVSKRLEDVMKNFLRLDKIISNLGIGSRTEVKRLMKYGLVTVDGVVVKDSSMKVCPEEQEILVEGQLLQYQKFTYIMMNKPQGVISATYDPKHKTCLDLLSEEFKNRDIFPVGRLDIDTEGLLLLTNNGKLAHNILSPKKHVWKKYFAKITGRVGEEDIKAFEKGISLNDGYITLPARLKILQDSGEEVLFFEEKDSFSKVEVMIKEGKFHQIKRMFEALGKQVVYLKRLEMADLILDESLGLGSYRELSSFEKKELLKIGGESIE